MEKVKLGMIDCLKAMLVGLAVSAAVMAVLFVIGFAVSKASWAAGLETAKNGLFLITSLGLFLIAGMLLIKGKKTERFPADNGWRSHFRVIGIKTAIGMVCVSFLFWAVLLDYAMTLLAK